MLGDRLPAFPDPPTRGGGGIRFGCGLVFGLIVGFLLFFRYVPLHPGVCLAWGLVAGLVMGVFSAAYGDRFWYRVIDWFQWLFHV